MTRYNWRVLSPSYPTLCVHENDHNKKKKRARHSFNLCQSLMWCTKCFDTSLTIQGLETFQDPLQCGAMLVCICQYLFPLVPKHI